MMAGGWLRGGVLALLAALLPGGARCQSVGTPAEPQYLMFQLFTAGPGFSTVPDRHLIDALPPADMLERQSAEILAAVGKRGDAGHRLGVMVGPLALDYTDAQTRTLIQRVFAIATKYRIAIGLHIDDAKFWGRRRELWSNPANVEWLDWQGTPNSGQSLNWGGGAWRLAPQACFNSPAMLSEARRLAGTVIGPAIAEGIAKLRQTGDEALFAGVIVGWETAIGQDFATRRNLGYCALTNLGFSEHKPPPDPDAALEGVVQGWIAAWSDALAHAGVPATRIYAHIAFKSKQQFDAEQDGSKASYAQAVMYTPPAVAFGDGHRPGFSTYPEAGMFAEIYAALGAHGHPPWGSAEGANVDMQSGPASVAPSGMESYLAHMFNHGASLANVFGWGVGTDNPFRRSAEAAESIAAYQGFLRGDRLQETPVVAPHAPLQDRMHALPDRIGALSLRRRRCGGDPARAAAAAGGPAGRAPGCDGAGAGCHHGGHRRAADAGALRPAGRLRDRRAAAADACLAATDRCVPAAWRRHRAGAAPRREHPAAYRRRRAGARLHRAAGAATDPAIALSGVRRGLRQAGAATRTRTWPTAQPR